MRVASQVRPLVGVHCCLLSTYTVAFLAAALAASGPGIPASARDYGAVIMQPMP